MANATARKPNIDEQQPLATMTRSWATLEIKSVDTDKREIRGVASTPQTDRMGDVVEPLGMEFKNPLPLLWQHRHAEPVGTVRLDKPTDDGVTFTAKLANVDEPGRLKDRIDEAWQSIKARLVRGVSIGFRALECSFTDEGIRFIKTEVMELSLVTIPANTDATIQEIRAFDAATPAAPGNRVARLTTTGAAVTAQKGNTMRTIADQISAFETRRKAAADRMAELMNAAADSGSTLDGAESEEYDGLQADVKKIDEHLARLVELERQNKTAAQRVEAKDLRTGSESRAANDNGAANDNRATRITVKSNVPPGIPFTRRVMAIAAGKGNRQEALAIFRANKQWMSESPEVEQTLVHDVEYLMKAPIAPGTTFDPTWAAPLVVAQNLSSEFAEFLRPLTIIGRIPGLRRVPFNISLPRATAGTSVNWVGEQAPKPVTSMAFDTVTLRWAKAAAIVVLTEELVRFSNPAAESVVRADLANAMTFFLDRQFVDPAVAEITNVSPASITNGSTAITASGTTAAAFRADVKSLFQVFANANLPTTGGVWIMGQSQALSLSLMQNSLGQQVFPTVNNTGGTLLGFPIVASENIPAVGGSPADGVPLIFVIAPEVMLADDGQILIDASREASVQMETAPDSPPTAASNMVSLWQMNMLGLRAERWINWKKRRAQAVAYISNAKYAE